MYGGNFLPSTPAHINTVVIFIPEPATCLETRLRAFGANNFTSLGSCEKPVSSQLKTLAPSFSPICSSL